MNKYKKYVGQLNRLKLKHGFHTLQSYRTGRIKNIRGRERLKFTVHYWEFHIDFLAHADRHIDRLSKHHRRLYRQ